MPLEIAYCSSSNAQHELKRRSEHAKMQLRCRRWDEGWHVVQLKRFRNRGARLFVLQHVLHCGAYLVQIRRRVWDSLHPFTFFVEQNRTLPWSSIVRAAHFAGSYRRGSPLDLFSSAPSQRAFRRHCHPPTVRPHLSPLEHQ
jgi:hypothetical protein